MSATAFQRRRREVEKKIATLEDKEVQEPEVNPLLEGLTVAQLKDIAKLESVEGYSNMKKAELLEALEGWNLDGFEVSES